MARIQSIASIAYQSRTSALKAARRANLVDYVVEMRGASHHIVSCKIEEGGRDFANVDTSPEPIATGSVKVAPVRTSGKPNAKAILRDFIAANPNATKAEAVAHAVSQGVFEGTAKARYSDVKVSA